MSTAELFGLNEPTTNAPIERREDGTAIVRGLKIFRAGTFKCSKGIKRTFTRGDLSEMVANFHRLRPQLPNIPARADHNRSVENIRGYVSAVDREGDYLVADIEFTEPDAADKWDRGTYRNRSAEIGPYQTNEGALFTNVLRGVAFVDLPAVEGLYESGGDDQTSFFLMEERPMPQPAKDLTPGTSPPADFVEGGAPAPTADGGAPGGGAPAPSADGSAPDGGAPAPTAEGGAPEGGAPEGGAPAEFTIGGQTFTEASLADRLAKVDELSKTAAAFERFQDETRQREIAMFTQGLIDGDKIVGTQQEPLAKLAATLDAEQFGLLREVFDGGVGHPMLAKFNLPTGGAPGDGAGSVEVLENTIAAFRSSGMTTADIENTQTFKELQELKGSN